MISVQFFKCSDGKVRDVLGNEDKSINGGPSEEMALNLPGLGQRVTTYDPILPAETWKIREQIHHRKEAS